MSATTPPPPAEDDDVYLPDEVARMFRVDPKTVTRWAIQGRFGKDGVFKTPGGHRRYRGPAVRALRDRPL